MNNLTVTKNKTPIEIALGIDEEGMTTARKLYEFLELNPSNYSKWCKSNIIGNQFADEGIDYKVFVPDDENPQGGRPTQDFKLTAHFAKKLSMQGKGEKGEQAREYFTKVEDKMKEIIIDRKALSPQLQLMTMVVENMSIHEIEQKRQAEKLETIESKQDAITQTFAKPKEEDFRTWVNKCLSKIAESENYHYIGSRTDRHKAVREEGYKRLNDKRPCRLKQRVESEKGRAAIAGASQTRINAINKLTIIESDKDLKPIYETVIREMMIAYCVDVN